MTKRPSDRRKFLRRGLSGAALAAAASVALPASAKSSAGKNVKKVIHKKGEEAPKDAVFSSAIQYGNLLFVSGAGAQDPVTHKVVRAPSRTRCGSA